MKSLGPGGGMRCWWIGAVLLSSLTHAFAESPADTKANPILEEVGKKVLRGFETADEFLSTKNQEVQGKTRAALTGDLVKLVRKWDQAAVADKRDASLKLIETLGQFCQSLDLELLVLVTQEGAILPAQGPGLLLPSGDERAAFDQAIKGSAEHYFGNGDAGVAVEALPRYTSLEGNRQAANDLFVVAGLPVFLSPNAPHSVLLGATSFAALGDSVTSVLHQSAARLNWQVFCAVGFDKPTITFGQTTGSVISKKLHKELSESPSSTSAALEDGEPSVCRWTRLLGRDKQLLGGWGVAADEELLTALLTTEKKVAIADAATPLSVAASSAGSQGKTRRLVMIGVIILGLTGLLGILWITVRSRQSEHGLPSSDEYEDSGLTRQFDVYWKTFATSTQDLLRETIRELEQSPERDVNELRERVELTLEELVSVRKQVSRVHKEIQNPSTGEKELFAQSLVEIKNELSVARNELKNSSLGVVRKITTVLNANGNGPSKNNEHLETVILATKGELHETQKKIAALNDNVLGLAELIGERQETATQRSVSESVEQVNAEWKVRFEEIRGEAHNGSQEAELLLKEIEETKNNEHDVCHKLADATRREDELKQRLKELQSQIDLSDNAREEAWKRECEIMSNLHESEKRERSVAENLDLAEEEAREAQDLASRLRTEAEELEAKLKQAEESAVENKAARKELEETRQDIKREREGFEREKRELTLKTKRLDARVVDLERQVDSDPAERLRMSQRCEELERELDSMRTSLKAMRDEREQLERQAQSAGSQRCEELERELDSMRTSLKAMRDEREQLEREQLERQAQSAGGGDDSAIKQLEDQVKQLQDDIARKDDQLRKQDAEISANHVATDDSPELRSRVESLESQISEAEKQRDSVQQQLQESFSVIADLETQLRSTHETARTDNSTLESIQDLKREKETLVRSLEQLRTNLNNATSDSEAARGFHNTLFENNLAVSLIVCHADLSVVNWNRSAEKLWKQDPGSIVGKNLKDLSWPCTNEVIRLSESVLNTNSAATIPKLAFQDVDDETRHVRVSVDPITSPSNEVIGLLIAVDDISEEIERDIEVRLQTLYAESLTESLPCALIVLDAKDRITSWNRNAEGIFGFSADEAMGKELFELKTPLKSETFKKRYVQTKERGRPKKLRVRLDGVQGKATQCLVTQSPFLGSDNSVRGTVLLLETQEPAKTT